MDKKSAIVLENEGEDEITVWALEFTYTITVPKEKLEDKDRFIRKDVTEKIKGPIKIHPRERKEFPTSIPSKLLKRIDVYYEERGIYQHNRMVLA